MAERAARRRPTRFDRVEILSRVSLAEVLTRELGHPKRAYGSERWWPSVDPALPGTGKTPPTHIVGVDSHGVEHFKDFASGRSGTAVDVLMIRRGLSAGEALRALAEQAGLAAGEPLPPPPERPRPVAARPAGGPPSAEFGRWVERCAERLWLPRHRAAGEAREWLAGRGFGEEILKAAKVGYDVGARGDSHWPKERRAERGIPNIVGVTFPMYGPGGELTYAQTRNLGWQPDSPWPKYVNPAGIVANPAVAYWRDAGVRAGAPVIVVEGPTDALAVSQVGYDVAALIGAGHAANPVTAERLVEAFGRDRPYVIMTDPDEAGRLAAEHLMEHLRRAGVAAIDARPGDVGDVAEWLTIEGSGSTAQALNDIVQRRLDAASNQARRILGGEVDTYIAQKVAVDSASAATCRTSADSRSAMVPIRP